jgi:hypothetical protein
MTTAPQLPAPRSTFVTVVAWIFMVLSGFMTLISLLQNVMFQFVFPATQPSFPKVDPATGHELPWIFGFAFSHFGIILLAMLIVFAGTFAASVGLLMRKNWARLLFIGAMALGIAWNIGGLLMMIPMFSMFSDVASSHPDGGSQFEVMWKLIAGVNLLFVAGFTFLFGWIIRRLLSETIRREFMPAADAVC